MKARKAWLPHEIARRCVFCGGQPSKKNREHVLPQWLLELTGDPSRVVPVAFDWATMKPIVFSWNAFTAPACKSCNDSFAKLEGAAKACVVRLLAGDAISGEAVDVLLRWLDKIRVGLWLLNNVLGGGPLSVAPTFAIRDRMDTADRLALVIRTSGPKQGLTIVGPSSPIFPYMPSCIGLVINGLVVINVSTQGLFGERPGFPWLDVRRVVASGQLEVVMKKATNEVKAPLLELEPLASFVRADKTQCMLAQWALLPSWGEVSIEGLMTDWCRARLIRPGLSRPLA